MNFSQPVNREREVVVALMRGLFADRDDGSHYDPDNSIPAKSGADFVEFCDAIVTAHYSEEEIRNFVENGP